MSNYMFLMQFHNASQLDPSDTSKMMLMSQIGSGISLIGCVMTLSILCFLDVKGDGLFIIGNMSVVMMAAQLSFIGAENTYPKPMMCRIAACILLYFFLALHFSSICYGIHLWSKLTAQFFPCRKRSLYLVLTWVVPVFVVMVTVLCSGDMFGREHLCWLPSVDHTRLAFLIPVTCILLLNVALFCRILSARIKHDFIKGRTTSIIIKNLALATISMIPVLNLPWLFGYSVTFDLHRSLQYTYVALCSGQGLLVFALHVMTTDQVRKAIFAKLAEMESEFSTSAACGGCAGTIESDLGNKQPAVRSRVKVEPKRDTQSTED